MGRNPCWGPARCAEDTLTGPRAVRGEADAEDAEDAVLRPVAPRGQQWPLAAPSRSAPTAAALALVPGSQTLLLSVEVPRQVGTVPVSGPSFPLVMLRVVAAMLFCAFASLILLEKYQKGASLADGTLTSALTTVISRMG